MFITYQHRYIPFPLPGSSLWHPRWDILISQLLPVIWGQETNERKWAFDSFNKLLSWTIRHRAQWQAHFALPQFNGRLNSTVRQKVLIKSLPSPFFLPPPTHSSILHHGERRWTSNKGRRYFFPLIIGCFSSSVNSCVMVAFCRYCSTDSFCCEGKAGEANIVLQGVYTHFFKCHFFFLSLSTDWEKKFNLQRQLMGNIITDLGVKSSWLSKKCLEEPKLDLFH